MKSFSAFKKLIPKPLKIFLAAYLLQRNPYYKRISNLPINRSGLSGEGIPFVELNTGRLFYGYPPTPSQRYYYKYFLDPTSRDLLIEECINVAFDIVLRYLGPESKEDHISQGKFYNFKTGDTVVEVGAYIGYYAIRAAELVGESGRVIAIEAIDENFQLLKRNVEAHPFKNIFTVPKAAWDSSGILKFYRHSRQQASAISTVIKKQEEISIPCDTLDNILNNLEINRVNFVRIQVNGAEQEVLNGMLETLEQYPTLLIAAIYERERQASWKKIKLFLENRGYIVQVQRGNIFAQTTT